MKKILLLFLATLARIILIRHKPYIIGVTGTVGKTTITTHIAHYLESLYGKENVMISPYHYNGEYGLPLSIIGARTGGKNLILWFGVFCVFLYRIFTRYPRYIVLEYGIDHPGEMTFLLSIAIPDIAILTPVAPNHLEQFGTLEKYRNEKLLITQSSPHVIVHDSLSEYIERKVYFYGKKGDSDISASDFSSGLEYGIRANVRFRDTNYQISIPALGEYQIENILPLYAIADILHIDPETITQYQHLFVPEPGRSSLIHLPSGLIVIDGSYNGGYESICRSIDGIIPFLGSHRIFFFLGDMRELGDESENIHTQLLEYIEKKIPQGSNVIFFLVGSLMQRYLYERLSLSYNVYASLSSRALGREIQKHLDNIDIPTIITVKGSQNTIFLEEGMKEFLDQKYHKNLTRQSQEWMKKKEDFFSTISHEIYHK